MSRRINSSAQLSAREIFFLKTPQAGSDRYSTLPVYFIYQFHYQNLKSSAQNHSNAEDTAILYIESIA